MEGSNNTFVDKHNGFRRKRSTIDHDSSVTSITETRKLRKKETYSAFNDIKKANDLIDCDKLWTRIIDSG